MPGSKGSISDLFSKQVQEASLILLAFLICISSFCSWPQRFLLLRQYLPQDISLKWFSSFASLGTVTKVQLAKQYSDLAEKDLKEGKLNEALNAYNKAIKLITTSDVLYCKRGDLYTKLNEYDLAIQDFLNAVRINPKCVTAYDDLGFIYAKDVNYGQALVVLSKAIEVDPYYAPAYYNLEIVYLRLKEYDLAWAQVHKAESLGINDDPDLMKLLIRDSGGMN